MSTERKLQFLENMAWIGWNTAESDKSSEVPHEIYEELFELMHRTLCEINHPKQEVQA